MIQRTHLLFIEMCIRDSGKAVQMAQMMHVPILGLVENMSYAVCPDCGKHIHVFGDSHVDEIAAKYKLPVLAKMPICLLYTSTQGSLPWLVMLEV